MGLRDIIVVIHFQPLEFYPPVQNLLSVLKCSNIQRDFFVISTTQDKLNEFEINKDSIRISRIRIISKHRLLRFVKYLYFYLFSFFKMVCYRPNKVIYFESTSALPAVLYKLIFKKTQLFAHYHEYTTPEEYQIGMQIVRWNHLIEVKNYPKFSWISHTNNKRLQLFKIDYPQILDDVFQVIPNYPLLNWGCEKNEIVTKININSKPIRLVYIGAVSIEDTYIVEIIQFLSANPDKYDLEIFSLQFPIELRELIENMKNVRYSGSLNYKDVPRVLRGKDIGLILYKGNTTNYIYNAPNKLFEYMVCGLDVWFPQVMQGCYEYASSINPKVVMVDFLNIDDSLMNYSFTNQLKTSQANKFNAEEACTQLIKYLSN